MDKSEKHMKRTRKSRDAYERAKRVLPGGVSYAIRDLQPYPFYVDRAKGSKLYDVDGNVYTDYWMGHGALILGHASDQIVSAVSKQIEKGTHYGYSHTLEVELAERVVKMVPSAGMLRFTNSGTEANMYAVRLARAYTGRKKIAKMEGGWHGGYDSLHKAVHSPFTLSESAGLNPKTVEDTLVLPFNDLEAAQKALNSEKLACIVLEPMLGAGGFILPVAGYLEGLKELCEGVGTLLIFDEVITGFRLALGGAQELFGVIPDITVLGKVLGGGFPIGAFCGSKEVFDLIDHRRYSELQDRAFHGGTFTGNPITMIAGIETLDLLEAGEVYEHMDLLGEKVRTGLKDLFGRHGIDAAITGVRSTFAIHFQKDKPKNARQVEANDVKKAKTYHAHMLLKGISYVSPTLPHMFISYSHTEEDIEAYLASTEEFIQKL